MSRRFPYISLLLLVLVGGGYFLVQQYYTDNPEADVEVPVPSEHGQGGEDENGTIDLTRKPLERIPVGTVVGKSPPQGWSHLVLIAIPTLVPEDEEVAPPVAVHYARLFKFTVLANVAPPKEPGKSYSLERVARGFATTLEGREKIVSSQNTLGAKLGVFGKIILKENEKILNNDVQQVVRTRTMLVFDAKSVMLRDSNHQNMLMRHALLVDPATGHLCTLVWLLTEDYEPAEDALQLLPEGMWEKRLLSVKRDKFLAGIPTRDAFALRQIPQGTPIPFTPLLKQVATVKTFADEEVPRIEKTLRDEALKAAGK